MELPHKDDSIKYPQLSDAKVTKIITNYHFIKYYVLCCSVCKITLVLENLQNLLGKLVRTNICRLKIYLPLLLVKSKSSVAVTERMALV